MIARTRLLTVLFIVVTAAAPMPGQEQGKEQEKKDSKSKEQTAEELAKKARKLSHELEVAKLKLELASLDEQVKTVGAESAEAKAGREHELAARKLSHFDDAVAPTRLTEAKITLDSASNRAQQAQDEYNELVAMYKQEEFAEMTKELVLKRGRHNLEIAQRRLKLQEQKLQDLEKAVLPRERSELAGKVQDAANAVKAAKLAIAKTKLEIRIAFNEANYKVRSTREDLTDVQKKLGEAVEK